MHPVNDHTSDELDRFGTSLTTSFQLGVPPRVVMEIVGHAALEMTMNVYAHVALDDQRQALDRLNGLLDDLDGTGDATA